MATTLKVSDDGEQSIKDDKYWLAFYHKVQDNDGIQEYTINGSRQVKRLDAKFVSEQIKYYTDKIEKKNFGGGGASYIK